MLKINTTCALNLPLGVQMMSATIRLLVYKNGRLSRRPVTLTKVTLRKVLLLASHDSARVDLICRKIEEGGRCEMRGTPSNVRYVLEKVLHA